MRVTAIIAGALALAGCASSAVIPFSECQPPNMRWFDGIPMASLAQEQAAKRLEVPAGKCGLYFYQDASWQNSYWEFDRVWPVRSDTLAWAPVVETHNDNVFAVWHLEPGRYTVYLEGMDWQGTSDETLQFDLECPAGQVIFLADTKNEGDLRRVDATKGAASIQKLHLSAGPAKHRYYSGPLCLPPGQDPP